MRVHKRRKTESIDSILDLIEAKKKGRIRKIVVYGCLPQRYKDILAKELPEVDAFVGRIGLEPLTKRYILTPRICIRQNMRRVRKRMQLLHNTLYQGKV